MHICVRIYVLEVRAGAIPDLFKNPLYLFDATYVGQKVARGVLADVWKVTRTKLNAGTFYAFEMQVYFFPEVT
jgi:hypothetical protein